MITKVNCNILFTIINLMVGLLILALLLGPLSYCACCPDAGDAYSYQGSVEDSADAQADPSDEEEPEGSLL